MCLYCLPTGEVINLLPNVEQFKPLQKFLVFAAPPVPEPPSSTPLSETRSKKTLCGTLITLKTIDTGSGCHCQLTAEAALDARARQLALVKK